MATSIDQQFIEYIVKSLVGNPDAVSIERRIDEKGVLLELTVDVEDLGRVIGKRGATAQSLRTLLRALGTKNDARYNLKIVDVGGPGPRQQPAADETAADEPAADEPADTPADEPADEPAEEPTEAPADEPADEPEPAEEPEEEEKPEERHTSMADRTRAELADLDDLDV